MLRRRTRSLDRRTPNRFKPGIATAVCALVLCGCSSTTESSSGDAAGSDAAIRVTDDAGTEIVLAEPAERVVCLDGTCVDALAELGLEPVAAQSVKTVTNPAFFGPDAETVSLGGTFFEPSLEDIVIAEPDLVVGAASVHAELDDALGGVPLYLASLGSLQGAVDNLMNLATLTGREEQGEEAAARFQETLDAYGPQERPLSALSMYGGATDDIGIDAADSMTGLILSEYTSYPWPEAGESGGFLEFSVEGMLEVDPDAIFVLDFAFDPGAPGLLEQLSADPIWQRLAAVTTGRVLAVDNTWWGIAYGTIALAMTLDVVMPVLYPEEFPEALGPLA